MKMLLNWCVAMLIGEDPYQYEHLTNDQIVDAYHRHLREGHHSRALVEEFLKRLRDEDLSYEDREILSKTIFDELKRRETGTNKPKGG